MSVNIYYSDFELQKSKRITSSNHALNLKLLMLLSDKVLIPLSNLLNSDSKDVKLIKDNFMDFFESEFLYTQLPNTINNIDDFYYERLCATQSAFQKEQLKFKIDLLKDSPLSNIQSFKKYDRRYQVLLFYTDMRSIIEKDDMITSKTKKDILNFIDNYSDENLPLSKLHFDNLLTEFKSRKNIDHLFSASELCYFSAGAKSNNTLISVNKFFDNETINQLKKITSNNTISTFYDPSKFYYLLRILQIVDDENDILNLSYFDIKSLRMQSTFRRFVDTYYEMSQLCSDLDAMIKQKKGKYERAFFFKGITLSLGLTIGETALTNYFNVPFNDTILFALVVFILQAFIENSGLKPIRILKKYTFDMIIDKIILFNDPFTVFCSNLKNIIYDNR